MPFKSAKQRELLKRKRPDVYRRWKAKYGDKPRRTDMARSMDLAHAPYRFRHGWIRLDEHNGDEMAAHLAEHHGQPDSSAHSTRSKRKLHKMLHATQTLDHHHRMSSQDEMDERVEALESDSRHLSAAPDVIARQRKQEAKTAEARAKTHHEKMRSNAYLARPRARRVDLAGFNPAQPRAAAGTSGGTGGQWAASGGSAPGPIQSQKTKQWAAKQIGHYPPGMTDPKQRQQWDNWFKFFSLPPAQQKALSGQGKKPPKPSQQALQNAKVPAWITDQGIRSATASAMKNLGMARPQARTMDLFRYRHGWIPLTEASDIGAHLEREHGIKGASKKRRPVQDELHGRLHNTAGYHGHHHGKTARQIRAETAGKPDPASILHNRRALGLALANGGQRRLVDLVGPKGFSHGWIKVGAGKDALSAHIKQHHSSMGGLADRVPEADLRKLHERDHLQSEGGSHVHRGMAGPAAVQRKEAQRVEETGFDPSKAHGANDPGGDRSPSPKRLAETRAYKYPSGHSQVPTRPSESEQARKEAEADRQVRRNSVRRAKRQAFRKASPAVRHMEAQRRMARRAQRGRVRSNPEAAKGLHALLDAHRGAATAMVDLAEALAVQRARCPMCPSKTDLAAGSMAKAMSPRPLGVRNLWDKPGFHLPPYIQHVASHLIAKHGKSKAIGMAVGIIKNWAHGHPSGGEKSIHPDTVAAARLALTQWEALKGRAKSVKSSNRGPAIG